MKKECAYTRSMLPRYLKGHLFLPQQKRVERHLASCAVCRSEFDSLRQIGETRRILKDITPPETVAGRMKERASGLQAFKKLFFRPLWLAAIVAAAAASYLFVIDPLLHDPDLEKLDAGTYSPAPAQVEAPPVSVPTSTQAPAVPAMPEPKTPPAASAAPRTDPLVVIITVEKENEKASIRTINEAMKEHALLKSMRFSNKVREISGSLLPGDLKTFFYRIQGAGKITYKRSRLASAGSELLPFVMKLQSLPAPAAKPVDKPVEKPVEKPGERPVDKTGDKPASPSPQAPQ